MSEKNVDRVQQIVMHMMSLEHLMCVQICHRCGGCIECMTAFAIMAKKITEETYDED